MEFKYGNNFHKLCVDWIVNNSLTRPYLADMEIKDTKYFFIDGYNIHKLDENSYQAFVRMMYVEVRDTAYDDKKEKAIRKWTQTLDPTSMSPIEFDSASATISQVIMQHYDNQDNPNPNFDLFYELLSTSSGKIEGQNFVVYIYVHGARKPVRCRNFVSRQPRRCGP